jgi:hypothetical protein
LAKFTWQIQCPQRIKQQAPIPRHSKPEVVAGALPTHQNTHLVKGDGVVFFELDYNKGCVQTSVAQDVRKFRSILFKKE